MELEGHDRLRKVPEEGLDGARDRLRLELERVVETGISWTVEFRTTFRRHPINVLHSSWP